MSEIESWLVRGGITATIAALAGLFMRVRTNESRLSVAEDKLRRYEATEKDVVDMKVLSAEINTKLDYLPRHDDLQKLHDRISKNGAATAEATTAVATLSTEVRGLREAVDRLHKIEDARSGK